MHNYSILEGYYYNKQDSDVTYHAKTILRYTQKTSYSKTTGDTGGLGGSETIEIEGDLPLIAKNKESTSFTWDWKHSSEQMNGWEKTVEVRRAHSCLHSLPTPFAPNERLAMPSKLRLRVRPWLTTHQGPRRDLGRHTRQSQESRLRSRPQHARLPRREIFRRGMYLPMFPPYPPL
jgi:hypothetical protein